MPHDIPSITDPSALLPPAAELRERLALALRSVEILRGLVRLSESVARRDGLPADKREVPHVTR